VRVVLSGHTELEAALRAAPIAHQFLSKPTDADALRQVVTRACQLQALVVDDEMRRTLGGIDSLPTAPKVYTALVEALRDPDITLLDVPDIVEQDAVMSGKVLQLMNSAFFGLPQSASSIRRAVNYLGISTLKNLVMTVEVFHLFSADDAVSGFSLDAEQAHALRVAQLAAKLNDDGGRAEEAFTAAILHDLGKLMLARYLPDYLVEVRRVSREESLPMHAIEQRLRGVTHAEIGAYLLDLWGLPYAIIEAVAHHHAPARVACEGLDLPVVLHVADWLAHGGALEPAGASDTALPPPVVDLACLQALGLEERVAAWRGLAERQGAS
jgi:putative nucleotidyltransferase with HDIG domain